MKPSVVYLDTSFFIGLLENQADRRKDAKEVIRFEFSKQSRIYTSILTINEFAVKYYDKFRSQTDCEDRVSRVIESIRDIANIYGITDEIVKSSARLMSVWGEYRQSQQPALPRDRKFRWDSLHLATANHLGADRVYAFDGPWNDFPRSEIPNIQQIICPACPPQPSLNYETEAPPSQELGKRKIIFTDDEK
jgi:predicted nucleic acid-binding protein